VAFAFVGVNQAMHPIATIVPRAGRRPRRLLPQPTYLHLWGLPCRVELRRLRTHTTHERPFFFNHSISTGKNLFPITAKSHARSML
jgi:hypothetical protein